MTITVHHPNQIGGCVTEIKSSKGTKIIIDVGSNLLGNDNKPLDIKGLTDGCAGVLISHYHGDHIGDFDKVSPGIDIYTGKVTKDIFKTLHETLDKKGEGNPELVEKFKTFPIGRHFKLPKKRGDIVITPLMVDHSAFDAYMFLIECDKKRILYTGDFRTHGLRGGSLYKMLKNYAPNIDLLIIEGTMLSRNVKDVLTEKQLGIEAKKLMSDIKNKNVFVWCSSTNIDSIAEFYHATPTDRPFIADSYQEQVLRIVENQRKSDLYNFSKRKIYSYSANNKKLNDWMDEKGFCMLIRPNEYSTYTEELLDRFPDNLIIYSMWEGYLEEGKPYSDLYKIEFLKKAMANGSRYKYLHTSGHATEDAICRVCEVTGAKKIFPIHSERAERFKELEKEGLIKGKVLDNTQSIESGIDF